ncbi:hypothetical protein ACHAXT_007658 [Thalassiosira profunda]
MEEEVSPNSNASNDSTGSNASLSKAAKSVGSAASRRPPQPPNNNKRRKHLPVKSSGYGRPSTPLGTEPARHNSRSRPSSPANSVASASSARSARSARSRLRHGNGTLSKIIAGDAGSHFHRPATRAARSRTPSPSPSLNRRHGSARDSSGRKKMARSTPSPAVGKRSREGNGGSALKRLKEGRREAIEMQSPSRKDYTRLDADPTPVREARRLSSNFRIYPPAPALAAASSPAAAKGNEAEAPLSYSKALRKGLESENGHGAAPSLPMSATKLFQSQNGHASNASASSLFDGFDPNLSETAALSEQIFSRQSGIDAPTLHRLLSQSAQSRGETKQWELRKRLEHKEEEASVLRAVLRDLLEGKEKFAKGAAGIEKGLRQRLGEAKSVVDGLNREKSEREKELNREKDEGASLKEKVQELLRDRESLGTKCEMLQSEVDGAKAEAARLQTANTDNAVAMALLESKLEESDAQREAAVAEVAEARAAKDEAVEEAAARATGEMVGEVATLRAKNEALAADVASLQAREAAVCQMMGVEADSVEFVPSIRVKVERYREDAKALEELDVEYESCKAELEKAKADHLLGVEALASKERDLSELMKSFGDIQRSGQEREQEAANQRRVAEERAVAAEGQAVDLREKLAALTTEKKSLEDALERSNAACASHEEKVATLQKEVAASKVDTVQHDSRLQLERDLRTKAEEKEAEERSERIALAAQLSAQLQEHALAQKQLRETIEEAEKSHAEQIRLKEDETRAKAAEVHQCQETITALEARQLSLKESLSDQKSLIDGEKENEIGCLKGTIANLESRLRSEVERSQSAGVVSEARVRELEEIIRKGQVERKRLHNLLQELRGNVRVFARIRPFIPDDGKQGEENEDPCVSHESDSVVSVPKQNDPSERHRFSFDRVFAPSSGQDAVFHEVSEYVQSALDGYQICLFSYGQTGSGKTFTMQGAGTGVMRGLIPRSIEQIAQHKAQMETDGWTFAMEVSFLEIYNEAIRDLLRENAREECKHDIKVGSDGRRTVTNLTIKPLDPSDREAVEAVLALAAKRRSTASTDMNATSSRSHSVFTLNLTAEHSERNQLVRGTLNLVDLAGSERLDRSNAVGQQAKEAVSINKSLSSLADVFAAIGQKQSHVPFRNSKLTWLLQPALSGDGKTLMFVNISPTEASAQESLCSLRFASKVNKCELGKAKRTVEAVKSNGNATKRSNAAANGKGGAAGRNVKRKL